MKTELEALKLSSSLGHQAQALVCLSRQVEAISRAAKKGIYNFRALDGIAINIRNAAIVSDSISIELDREVGVICPPKLPMA